MQIHYLQHVPFEDLAKIEPWAEDRGHTIRGTRLYAGQDLPDPDDVDWLIVLGGPMGVHEDAHYPWLSGEKAFIRSVLDRDSRVLGICLGAQLVAHVLGAEVAANPEPEIGWFPITRSRASDTSPFFKDLPEYFTAFHWHGDAFELPEGAVHLASSATCPNQAFSYGGRVLGLQFHLESSLGSIERLIQHCGHEMIDRPYIQSPSRIRNDWDHYLPQLEDYMRIVLEALEAA